MSLSLHHSYVDRWKGGRGRGKRNWGEQGEGQGRQEKDGGEKVGKHLSKPEKGAAARRHSGKRSRKRRRKKGEGVVGRLPAQAEGVGGKRRRRRRGRGRLRRRLRKEGTQASKVACPLKASSSLGLRGQPHEHRTRRWNFLLQKAFDE